MTDEILEAVKYRLKNDHPVMAAMATKLERTETTKERPFITTVRLTFDGPALPEKQHFELALPVDDFDARPLIEHALNHCESSLAAAMKRSGLGV